MIFFTKRHNTTGRPVNLETCLSIIGLFLVIGLIGGLSALIYGLVKGSLSGIIGGGVVLGVSVILSIIFALLFVCYFKNNNVNSNANEQRTLPHQTLNKHNRNHQQNHRFYHEKNSSHEITTVSGKYKHDNHFTYQQQTSKEYDVGKHAVSTHQNMALGDSMNSMFERQSSLNKISRLLNQSNSSIAHQNQ